MLSLLINPYALILVTFIIWIWWSSGYFQRRGVKSPAAYVPVLRHMFPTLVGKLHFKDLNKKMYDEFPNERYIGMINFGKTVIFLRDVELIKQVVIKDFEHFTDHMMASFDEESDLVFGRSLFSLKGQRWRDMRSTLSPAFTSSRMKGMFQYIVDCGDQVRDYYIEESKTPEYKVRGLIEVDMKDIFTRYANDVIATCAFGLEVDSFTDRNNQFYNMGKRASDFSGIILLNFFIVLFVPRLARLLNIKIFSDELADFYRGLIWDTIKYREKNGIVRNDMINILMEARKGTLKHESHEDDKETGFATVKESAIGRGNIQKDWSDDDLVAQAILFFVAGFDTASTLLSFMAYELGLNPEVQRRLQKEIDEVAASVDGKLTYDCLQRMKYLDMVVCETLRMWPPFSAVDRKCVKPYTMPPSGKDGKPFELEVGNGVWIPIHAIHHDPKYHPNPETFDPERFSDQNKHKINPMSYLPFGVGPRNCIGSRFALMEVKTVMFNLLRNFDIVTTAKTQIPIKLRVDNFNMHSENGFWMGLKLRQ